MSPDPPRSEEEISSGTIYFMQGSDDDDDFMDNPNGEHVLDFSDHESEFSDDDDDDGAGEDRRPANPSQVNPDVNDVSSSPGDQNPRVMARYQLLIPFPPAENHVESSDNEELDTQQLPSLQQQQQSTTTTNSSNSDIVSPPPATDDNDKDELSKREIVLSDDKVEIIKNAMKGFTLPPQSIPQWVDQVDETSWKERLFETIQQKSTTN